MIRILITDDIDGWLKFHANVLKSILGHDLIIDFAYSAWEGYNKVLENNNTPYDYILTDLQMENDYEPKYAGEWFVEQIKALKNFYNTKIIIISATYNIRQIAENLGVYYIPKSVARVSIDAYKELFSIK